MMGAMPRLSVADSPALSTSPTPAWPVSRHEGVESEGGHIIDVDKLTQRTGRGSRVD